MTSKPGRGLYEHRGVRQLGYRRRRVLGVESSIARVSKSELFDRPDNRRLSNADVQQLLAISFAPGTTWKGPADLGKDQTWIRSDRKVVALLNEDSFCECKRRTSTSRNHRR